MTTDLEQVRADLRALMTTSMLGLPDYSVDPLAIRRVGKLLAEASERAVEERRFSRGY
jgi:hypothetical protein